MASILKVDKLDPQSGTALEVGTSGDTITVPSGVGLTLTNSTLLLPTTVTATTEVKTNKVSPATGTDFTLGDSGDTFTVPSGATIVNSGTATGFGGGAWTLIKSQTITSTTASMLWVDGTNDVILDNTYKCYVLLMTDYLASDDESSLYVQISTDTGSTYKTSGYYSVGSEAYSGGAGTGPNYLSVTNGMVARNHVGNLATETVQGQLWIYNPSSATTYPTMGWQFYFAMGGDDMARTINGAGGYRTATAYDGFKILPDAGNIENLQATLYGITT